MAGSKELFDGCMLSSWSVVPSLMLVSLLFSVKAQALPPLLACHGHAF